MKMPISEIIDRYTITKLKLERTSEDVQEELDFYKKELANLHKAWQSGDLDTVREINDRLLPLHNALFCETSPGPVKYAAHLLGMCSADARLPICEIAEESKSKVQAAMRHAGLIN